MPTAEFVRKCGINLFFNTFMIVPAAFKIPTLDLKPMLQRSQSESAESVLARILNKHPTLRSKLIFRNTADIWHDEELYGRIRPTLCAFTKGSARKDTDKCVPNVELFFESKLARAFEDHPLFANLETVRKRVYTYVQQVFNYQHRTHMFSVSLLGGNRACFIRWDRSCAIVTETFDYIRHPEILAEFLVRFNRLDLEGRGFDASVRPASAGERMKFTRAVADFRKKWESRGRHDDHPLDSFAKTLKKGWPTVKLSVQGKDEKKPRWYVVQKPFVKTSEFFGRATRAYIAWGITENKLVFLKDAWRTDGLDTSEEDIYAELNGHTIPHVPELIAIGDVWCRRRSHPQSTENQSFAKQSEYTHYRLVQSLAFPLKSVRRSYELVSAIRNALYAMKEAYRTCKILHRDVSTGNIMLNDRFEGILNDWDCGIKLPVVRPHRVGTWRTLSIRMSKHYAKFHELADDAESALWVFLYVAVQNFQSSDDNWSDNWFEEKHYCVDGRGSYRKFGGNGKLSMLKEDYIRELKFASEPLDAAIHGMAAAIAELYPSANKDDLNVDTHFPELAEKSAEEKKEAELAYVSKLIQLLDGFLARSDWPEKDWIPRSAQRWGSESEEEEEEDGWCTSGSAKRSREEAEDGEDSDGHKNEDGTGGRPAKQRRLGRAGETAQTENGQESEEV